MGARARSRSSSGSGSRRSTARSSRCSSSDIAGLRPTSRRSLVRHAADRPDRCARATRSRRRATRTWRCTPRSRSRSTTGPRGRRELPPEGSFLALAGDDVVGLSGLCRNPDGAVEDGADGLVRRLAPTRSRGGAQAGQVAWAAANGVDGDCHLDADGQRGDAEPQRAARLHRPQRQHRPRRSPGRLTAAACTALREREHRLRTLGVAAFAGM